MQYPVPKRFENNKTARCFIDIRKYQKALPKLDSTNVSYIFLFTNDKINSVSWLVHKNLFDGFLLKTKTVQFLFE